MHILADGFCYLEAPRWHQGALWVSDFYQHAIFKISFDGQVEKIVDVPHQPSGLGWLADGRLLIVSMKDQKVLQYHQGVLSEYADLSHIATGHCNDLITDADGRAWVGNFSFDLMRGDDLATAQLARIDPDGSVHVAATELYFPNGMAIVNHQLLVNETFGNRISAFAIDQDGNLGPRQDWVKFAELATGPALDDYLAACRVAADGASVADQEGAIWIADALGQRGLRILDGKIVESISTALLGCFACALGGETGNTLFLCVAPDFQEQQRAQHQQALIYTTSVAVPAAALSSAHGLGRLWVICCAK